MPDHPQFAEVPAGVVINRHRQVDAPGVIMFDRCDGGDAAAQHRIHYVSAATRIQANAIALLPSLTVGVAMRI